MRRHAMCRNRFWRQSGWAAGQDSVSLLRFSIFRLLLHATLVKCGVCVVGFFCLFLFVCLFCFVLFCVFVCFLIGNTSCNRELLVYPVLALISSISAVLSFVLVVEKLKHFQILGSQD